MFHNLSRRLIMVVGMGLIFAEPTLADVREDRPGYERGDNGTFIPFVRRMAEPEEAKAQYALTNMNRTVSGVLRRDQASANGDGKGRKRKQAEVPIRFGAPQANNPEISAETVEFVKWYRRAAEDDDIPAQFQLGYMYDTGLGVAPNRLEAEKWYRSAADRGDPWAQYRLALLYMNGGYGLAQDHDKALLWLETALDRGNPLAETYVTRKCFGAVKARTDREETLAWCGIAAERGDPDGQFAFGIVLSEIEGWPADLVQAHMWFDIATTADHSFASEKRGRLTNRMTAAEVAEARRLARAWRPKYGRHSIGSHRGIAGSRDPS